MANYFTEYRKMNINVHELTLVFEPELQDGQPSLPSPVQQMSVDGPVSAEPSHWRNAPNRVVYNAIPWEQEDGPPQQAYNVALLFKRQGAPAPAMLPLPPPLPPAQTAPVPPPPPPPAAPVPDPFAHVVDPVAPDTPAQEDLAHQGPPSPQLDMPQPDFDEPDAGIADASNHGADALSGDAAPSTTSSEDPNAGMAPASGEDTAAHSADIDIAEDVTSLAADPGADADEDVPPPAADLAPDAAPHLDEDDVDLAGQEPDLAAPLDSRLVVGACMATTAAAAALGASTLFCPWRAFASVISRVPRALATGAAATGRMLIHG
ncbi:hypothetical protein WJX81_004599 [Elliptochloris bilobata]|uniref:Uncharacterized protein n=1 Tax=Elliptochloris bilobata TaxID=381761 RepID=A0AAW1SJG6_9CHLO